MSNEFGLSGDRGRKINRANRTGRRLATDRITQRPGTRKPLAGWCRQTKKLADDA